MNLVYTEEEDYVTADYAKEKGLTEQKLSGTKFRKMLRAGDDIPTWFAFESVVKVNEYSDVYFLQRVCKLYVVSLPLNSCTHFFD